MLDPVLLAAYNEQRTAANKGIFCHAPFTSMNFAQNGDCTVCCYNRKYVLGTYPLQSLDDMWHGPQARRLRERMSHNDLPAGCDLCLSQFWSRNFSGLKARFYDTLSEESYGEEGGRLLAFPKVIEFEISNVCNLECSMCTGFFSSSIRHNREHLPPLKTPYDDGFIGQLEPFIPHLKEARFLGGEPFLVRPYYEIWDLILRLNPELEISITTNATTLNDRIKRLLEQLRANIIVSIDSLQRDNYERIRVNARYDDVMEHVHYFKDYTRRQGTQMTLAVCPMRQNWRDLPEIIRFCSDEGVAVFFNTVVFPGEATFRYMARRDLVEVVETLGSVPLVDATPLHRYNHDQFRGLLRQIEGYAELKTSFRSADARAFRHDEWDLHSHPDNAATLGRADGAGMVQRIVIEQATGFLPWNIQMRVHHLAVEAHRRYVVQFRARADAPRPLTVGIGEGHHPYEELGVCVEMALSPAWEWFELDGVARRHEPDARLFFNVGASDVAVEIADVSLRIVPAEHVDEEPIPAAAAAADTILSGPKPLTFFR